MPEFLELVPPAEALQILLDQLIDQPLSETIHFTKGLHRVLSKSITAPHPLPSFPRTTVDGYALHAADTFGASDSLPAYLRLVGEVPMGKAPDFSIQAAQCALIHTGGMLPQGANAVVMVEHTQMANSQEIEILRAVAPGENTLKIGEDVSSGELVLEAGTQLRPAELGGLAALGVSQLSVNQQPRVAILSTGDEVVPIEDAIQPGQVRDVNTHTLTALVMSNGGIPISYGIIPDNPYDLSQAAARSIAQNDMVIFTAGSSASTRDLTARIINELGQPGVLVHGVNVKPGKPTILGICQPPGNHAKPVIGLPGNPVSALVIAWLFVVPIVRHLQGIHYKPYLPNCIARLTINLPSQAGREDWTPVKLVRSTRELFAEPVFGKSNLIFTLAKADGLVRTPAATTGLSAGEMVEVFFIG